MRTPSALLFSFALMRAYGQLDLPLQWQLCLGGISGDFVRSVTPLSDQGCLVVGHSWCTFGTQVPAGERDMWLTRIDAGGTVLWQRLMGGPSADYAQQVAVLPNGDFLLCGYTVSTSGTFGALPGAILAKISSNGDLIWSHRYGGTLAGGGSSSFSGIALTPDGGCICIGHTSSADGDVSGYHGGTFAGFPAADAWLVKLDQEGQIEWQRCLGGTRIDGGEAVGVAADGNYVVACSSSSVDGDVTASYSTTSDLRDIWVVKLTPDGEILWDRNIGGSDTEQSGQRLVCTSDGGVIVQGDGSSSDGDLSGTGFASGIIVAKVSSDGDVVWARKYPEVYSNGGYGAIAQSTDGHLWVTGTRDPGAYVRIMELGPNGGSLQQAALGGTQGEGGMDIATDDAGIYVLANTLSIDGDVPCTDGETNGWLMRFRWDDVGIDEGLRLNLIVTTAAEGIQVDVPSALIGSLLTMHDAAGRAVNERRLSSSRIILPAAHLASGHYTLAVIGDHARAFSHVIWP